MDRGLKTHLLATLLIAGLLVPSLASAKAPYRNGETVVVQGQVTDADGKPLAGITVLLEMTRSSFRLGKLKKVQSNTLQVLAVADAAGTFRHEWQWDAFYNTFDLVAGMPTKKGGKKGFEVLLRADITQRVEGGSPVASSLTIDGDVGWLHRLLDGSAGSEETRVFNELGKPDRFDVSDDGTHAWWYFEAGKAYRFRDGELEEVDEFEPVKPL